MKYSTSGGAVENPIRRYYHETDISQTLDFVDSHGKGETRMTPPDTKLEARR
jgi:hypothetical protein